MLPLALLLAGPAHATIPAAYGVIEHRFTETVREGTAPMLTLKAPEAEVVFVVQCSAGDQTLEWESGVVPQGEDRVFVLAFEGASTREGPKDRRLREAECGLFARMANGLAERKMVHLAWTVEPAPDPGAEPAPTADPAGQAPADPAAPSPASVVTPKGQEPKK